MLSKIHRSWALSIYNAITPGSILTYIPSGVYLGVAEKELFPKWAIFPSKDAFKWKLLQLMNQPQNLQVPRGGTWDSPMELCLDFHLWSQHWTLYHGQPSPSPLLSILGQVKMVTLLHQTLLPWSVSAFVFAQHKPRAKKRDKSWFFPVLSAA